jgi:hypothetical protein
MQMYLVHTVLTREDPLHGKGLCWSEVPPTPHDGLPGCEGESPLRGLPVGLWAPPGPVSGHENMSLKSCIPSIPSGMSSFRAENNSSSPSSGSLMCCSWNAVWEDWKQNMQSNITYGVIWSNVKTFRLYTRMNRILVWHNIIYSRTPLSHFWKDQVKNGVNCEKWFLHTKNIRKLLPYLLPYCPRPCITPTQILKVFSNKTKQNKTKQNKKNNNNNFKRLQKS